jgi:hypothetical protein
MRFSAFYRQKEGKQLAAFAPLILAPGGSECHPISKEHAQFYQARPALSRNAQTVSSPAFTPQTQFFRRRAFKKKRRPQLKPPPKFVSAIRN